MEAYEQLDYILSFINTSSENDEYTYNNSRNGCYYDSMAIVLDNSFTKDKDLIEINSNLSIILEELENDGNIKEEILGEETVWDDNYPDAEPEKIPKHFYFTTFKGKVFIENGGYAQKFKRENEAIAVSRKSETQIVFLQKVMSWSTVVLAFGTLSLVLIEVYKIYRKIP